jgi:hypothetical protein
LEDLTKSIPSLLQILKLNRKNKEEQFVRFITIPDAHILEKRAREQSTALEDPLKNLPFGFDQF